MQRRYGLIGYPLGHSLSPLIHERIMDVAGINGEYRLYELDPSNLNDLTKLLDSLDGFNCTIPYKRTIIPYLEGLAPSANLYGAVNTVQGRVGHNTDGAGFAACGVPLQGRSVCILGSGGVARVFAVEAAKAGATRIILQARNILQAQALVKNVKAQGFQNIDLAPGREPVLCDVLLNGTPCGMWPKLAELPATQEQIGQAQAIFDAIYNPSASRLVLKAISQDIWAMGGLKMLFEQALAAQKIWNPDVDFHMYTAEFAGIEKDLAKKVLNHSPFTIVLTGFMGSGKTYVGRLLAERMELPFVDLDENIAKRAGQSIADIFRLQGEEAFRKIEQDTLLEQLRAPEARILATGGGAVIQNEMAEQIHDLGALVIYLDVSLETALSRTNFDANRPLLQGGAGQTERLYQLRRPLYSAASDLRVDGEKSPVEIVDGILRAFAWHNEGEN